MKDKRIIHLQLWKQALDRLSEVLAKTVDDRIVIDAAIQRFEFCFELGLLDLASGFDSQLSKP